MNHDPFHWGRPSDKEYGRYNYQISEANNNERNINDKIKYNEFPKMNTQQPMITGTSVIAVKYNEGVIIAADNLGSYGSLLKIDDLERLIKVGENIIVGISGDISDLQQIERILDELTISDSYDMDPEVDILQPKHVHEYLTRILYNRRSKMNPLWNSIIVSGIDTNTKEVFLKYVDLYGVSYGSPSLATGFGAHLAIPLLRKKVDTEEDVSKINKEEAIELVKECMKVLFYRDARSLDKYSLCVLNKNDKIEFLKNLKCEDMSWNFARHIKGYGAPQL